MLNFGDRGQGEYKTWQLLLILALLAGMSFVLAFFFTMLLIRHSSENRAEIVSKNTATPKQFRASNYSPPQPSDTPLVFQALPEMPDGRQRDLDLANTGLEITQTLDLSQFANSIARTPLPSKLQPEPIVQPSQLATTEVKRDRPNKTPEPFNNSISLPKHIRAKATTQVALSFEPQAIADGNSESVVFVTLAEPLKDFQGKTLLPSGTKWSALPRLLRNPMVEELNPQVQILELEAIDVTIDGVEYKIPPGKITIRREDDLPLFAEKKFEKKIEEKLTEGKVESIETFAFFLPKGIKVQLTVKDAVQVALSN
jgi:hypothetical protein